MSNEILEMTPDAEMLAGLTREQSAGQLVSGSPGQPNDSMVAPIITAQKVQVHRDLAKVMNDLRILAGAAGTGWFYRYPVKSKNGGKSHIEGPSIKLANDLVRVYGNCAVDVRAFDQGDHWIFYARFVDYETGFSMTRAFQQRKNQSSVNTKDDGRQMDIAFQIGQSKAIRNVVVNALQSLADYAFDEARSGLVEKVGKSLDMYRERVRSRLEEIRVDIRRVERVRGRAADKWMAEDVTKVISEIQAVSDGMALAEELWPELDEEAPPAPKKPERKKNQAKKASPSSDKDKAEDAETVEEEPEAEADSPASEPEPEAKPQDEVVKKYTAHMANVIATTKNVEELDGAQAQAKKEMETKAFPVDARRHINTMFAERRRELSA